MNVPLNIHHQATVQSPRVSVHMPAYNHEKYIGEALDSALRQQTTFPFEIVIGEDCSTDGTRAVAREYARAHADRITLIEHDKNIGIWENDQTVIAGCRGEYIAWLESDDYWTRTDKLQRMVDYLDRHPEASACFHRAGCKTDSIRPITWRGGPDIVKPFYTADDLLEQGHFIPSCTAVFRTALVREPLSWTRGTPFLETAYSLRFALSGHIGFIDEEMAMYRYHGTGVYGQADEIGNIERSIAAHRLVGKGFDLGSRPAYRRGLANKYAALGQCLQKHGQGFAALVARARSAWYRA